MALIIRKAERRKAKLRLGISGPSGSGKTFSSLEVAFGIGGPVGLIDTENGSGDLYAHLGDYDVCPITAPFTVEKYLEAIHLFEQHLGPAGTIIIDSLSHAWAGEGGLLEQVDAAASKGNKFAAWRNVSPQHNRLVESLLQSPCHIIATTRAKSEYVQEKNEKTGKIEVRKIGLAAVQRDGLEYEFTVFLDLTQEHAATASKDRTGLLDGKIIRPSRETGRRLLQWLEGGAEAPAPEQPAPVPQPESETDEQRHQILPKRAQQDRTANAAQPPTGDPAPPRDAKKTGNDRLWAVLKEQALPLGFTREQVVDIRKQLLLDHCGVDSSETLGPDDLNKISDLIEASPNRVLMDAHHKWEGAKKVQVDDDIPEWTDEPKVDTSTGEVKTPIVHVDLWLAACEAMPDLDDEVRLATLNKIAKRRLRVSTANLATENGARNLAKALREDTDATLAIALDSQPAESK